MTQTTCRIIFEVKPTEDDNKLLKKLLQKDCEKFYIEFGLIYNISLDTINILYKNMFVRDKNVELIVHTNKLNRYLRNIGFKTNFNDLTKKEILGVKSNLVKNIDTEDTLDEIFELYGYDLKNYKREMIQRRIELFMIKYRIKETKTFVNLILSSKIIFKNFFLDVSINVTEFFRCPKSFKKTIEVLEKYKNSANVKIWVAGSSSGEEAYSIAIILKNLQMLKKSLIYATDFNKIILSDAKNGIYSKEAYQLAKNNFEKIGLDEDFDKYIIKNNNYITINEKLKKNVLFFVHDLVNDNSFNEFDIITCKNVIIYFNQDLQKRVFKLFYDSLRFGGYLVLGESESLHVEYVDKFKKYESNCKTIFRKVA